MKKSNSAQKVAHKKQNVVEKTVLYFAFGSNLDRKQMKQRCPSAVVVARAFLPEHALGFTGFSGRWNGAVATVKARRGATTQGLLYSMLATDLDLLDVFEGHPYVYRRCQKIVRMSDGERALATVYVRPLDEPDYPSPDYLKVILRAYHSNGFDLEALKRAALEARR